jgi:hypoxanthine phosphoribosyltransferase
MAKSKPANRNDHSISESRTDIAPDDSGSDQVGSNGKVLVMVDGGKSRPKRCFVVMPSGNHKEYSDGTRESEFIFKSIIVPAVKEAYRDDVEVEREADASSPGAIDKRIVEQTASADIAIVDITGQNPNVFFELGMRYVLKKSTTILLRQKGTEIPFDIAPYRCVEYDPKWDGAEISKRRIREAIISAIKSPQTTDSLVYNVYPSLTINLNPHEVQPGHDRDIMPWDVYWAQINEIEGLLTGTVHSGRYHPFAMLGLSNGGMIVADLFGRSLFKQKTPTASLWVDRVQGNWLENALNRSVMKALEELAQMGGSMDLLLVDDIVASGTTLREAVAYLKNNLPNVKLSFLPIFSANERYHELIKDLMLWLHPAFKDVELSNRERIQSIHSTKYHRLPYRKDIRST